MATFSNSSSRDLVMVKNSKRRSTSGSQVCEVATASRKSANEANVAVSTLRMCWDRRGGCLLYFSRSFKLIFDKVMLRTRPIPRLDSEWKPSRKSPIDTVTKIERHPTAWNFPCQVATPQLSRNSGNQRASTSGCLPQEDRLRNRDNWSCFRSWASRVNLGRASAGTEYHALTRMKSPLATETRVRAILLALSLP